MAEKLLSIELELSRTEEGSDPYAFRFARQEYRLRTKGGGVACAELSWSQALLDDLATLRATRPDPAIVQRVGETLRAFLKPAGWKSNEAAIAKAVQSGQQVMITLRSAAAELYALPWELMTVGPSGQHLGELPGVLIRYEWPETSTAPENPSPRPEGGRILIAWSAAAGQVPAVEHINAIKDAADAGFLSFDPKRDVLAHASYGRLKDALDAAAAPGADPIAALHLLCHGGATGSTYGLVMNDDESDEGVVVDAAQLRRLLAPHAGRVRMVLVAACDSGNTGAAGNALGSVAQTIHRAGIESVIASRFPLSVSGSNRLTEKLYHALVAELCSVEQALLAAREDLAKNPSRLDWASLQLYARAEGGDDSRPFVMRPYNRPVVIRPYRGLLAFQPEHSRFFFGRDTEISELVDDLNALVRNGKPRFLVVAGTSGTGKSSMVLAGAVPRLLKSKDEAWEFVSMRPGSDPLAALEQALAQRKDLSRPLLLVVDQLEEIFTQTEEQAARQAFAQRVWALAGDPESGVHAIFTIRVDFIGRCGEILLDENGLRLDRIAYDEAYRIFVAQMAREQIEAAITKPAGLVGLELEAGLVSRMLDDVGAEPGALPLLQDTLDLLWQKREGRLLTQAAYDAVGGVAGALHGRADALLDSLDDASRKVARRLLVRLVGLSDDMTLDTRRRVRLKELRPSDANEAARFDRVLSQLVDERLLVLGEEGNEASVEVAHEALIRNWDRLRQWVHEDRDKLLQFDKLAQWVVEWKAHGTLLSAGQLAYAEEVARQHGEDLNKEARGLLAESQAAARRKRRAQKLAVAGVAAAALGFAVLGWWGMRQARLAEEHAAIAEKNEGHAHAHALKARDAVRVSTAQRFIRSPAVAMTLLRGVEASDPGQIDGWLGAVPYFESSPVFLRRSALEGHESAVVAAAWSPDGATVLTASRDGKARIWRANGELVVALEGHRAAIAAVAWSPDGKQVITSSNDKTARIWKIDGSLVTTLEGHTDAVVAAAWSPDGETVATASQDNSARIWKIDGTPVTTLRGHAGPIRAIAFRADGSRIVTASDDRTARIWKSDGKQVAMLEGHGREVYSVAWSADGKHIVTASADGSARIWREDDKPLSTLKGHHGAVLMATWSPDGKRIVTVSRDKSARIWEIDGTLISELRGHGDVVRTASWSPDGRLLLTASEDDTARVWTAEGALLAELKGHAGAITTASFSPDGSRVITASEDRSAWVWEADSSIISELKGHEGPVRAAAWSPDGTRIVTVSDDKSARIWMVDGKLVATLEGHEASVVAAAWSPDGARIVTASRDQSARIWMAEGRPVAVLKGHGAALVSAAWSADGKRIVTASEDKTAKIWTAEGKLVETLEIQDEPIVSAAFGANSLRLVTASENKAVDIWTAEGTRLATLVGHEDSVVGAAWNPDATMLATASADKTARIWTSDGKYVATLMNHSGPINTVAWNASGTNLVTASQDGTSRIYTADGVSLAVLKGHSGPVHSASFNADGTRIVTSSEDATARVWLIEPRAIRRLLWSALPECIPPETWSRIVGGTKSRIKGGYEECQALVRCIQEHADSAERQDECLRVFRESRTRAANGQE